MAKLSDVSENILETCLYFLNFVKKYQKTQIKIIAFFGKVFNYYWTNPVFFDIIYMYSCVRKGIACSRHSIVTKMCNNLQNLGKSGLVYGL